MSSDLACEKAMLLGPEDRLPILERIVALEAEREDLCARLREACDEHDNRQAGWNSERDAITAENERLKERLEVEKKINAAYTDRWLSAWEKYNKATNNAEATGVFREFLKEPWTSEQIAAATKHSERADAAEQEADKWRARCANAVFLIPGSVLCGDIRKEADSFMAELAAAKARADAAEAKLAAVRERIAPFIFKQPTIRVQHGVVTTNDDSIIRDSVLAIYELVK